MNPERAPGIMVVMQSKLLRTADGQRTFVVVLDTGDEAFRDVTDFARRERVDAASLTAIGAFERAVLGFYDLDRREYDRLRVDEQVEVVSLVGDLSLGTDGAPMLHAHVVVARRDGSTLGGHLLEGRVRPTLEIVVSETDAHLRRRYDERSGLPLIALDES